MTLDQAQSPSRHLAPGTMFDGRYWVVSYIGAGGMAHVYKVRHSHLDQILALKLLRHDVCNDPRRVKRFKQEAKAASSLNHANLVNVQGFGIADGTPYLVMEYVEGDGLDAILDAEGPMAFNRVVMIGKQVASALGFLHQHRIVHRDIKPANIIGTADGVYKVVDFGIAKAEEMEDSPETVDNQSLTKTGTIVGTPAYMSPEQSMGQKADRRSDIYSLGCLLFELATGKPPYEADSHYTMLAQHLKAKVPSLSTKLSKFDHDALDAVLQKCLAKSPADRFQTMEELIGALTACESEAPREAAPGQRRRARSPKNPEAQRAALNAALLSISLGLLVSIPLLVGIPDPQTAKTSDRYENFSVQHLRNESVRYVLEGNRREALNLLQAAMKKLASNPHSDSYQMADVKSQIGFVLKDIGEPGLALPYFIEAQKVYSRTGSMREKDSSIMSFNIGICLARLGRWREGAEAMENALASGSGGADVLYALAETYCTVGRYAETGGHPYVWEDKLSHSRTIGGKWNGKPWGSLQLLRMIERDVPEERLPYVREMIVVSLLKLKRYAEAESYARLISENNPSLQWLVKHRLARIRLATGDFQAAEQLLGDLIADAGLMQDHQINAGEHFDRGLVRYRQGKFEDAEKDFQQAYSMFTAVLAERADPASMKTNFDMMLCAKRACELARYRLRSQSGSKPPAPSAAPDGAAS